MRSILHVWHGSEYASASSTHHILLLLPEELKMHQDIDLIVAVLMNLSKYLDCIFHDLLVAKLCAVSRKKTVLYIHSRVKNGG